MTRPTFSARFLRDGSTAFRCIQTGVRYIIANAGRDCGAFREGELIRTGERAMCVDAIESDARWAIRSTKYDRAWQGHMNDPMRPLRPHV